MQFKEGANVFTSDGQKVGSIDRIVIDPQTKEVTHVVVQKGFLFTEDKVVPLSLVGPSTEDRVTLREDAGDLERLPDFKETHYVWKGEEETRTAQEAGYALPLYWYPPVNTVWWYPGYHGYAKSPYVLKTERNIPEGTVALEEGAKALSSDGEHVGDVERVFTEPQENRATHLLLSQGLLLKQRKLVPTRWVTHVFEDEVHLAVGSHLLDALPEYQPQS
jgi:uncharacterized protein YrrD